MAQKTNIILNIKDHEYDDHYALLQEMDKLERDCLVGRASPNDGVLNWCEQGMDLDGDYQVTLKDLLWLNEKTGRSFTIPQFVRAFKGMPCYRTFGGAARSTLHDSIAALAKEREDELNGRVLEALANELSPSEMLKDIAHLKLYDLAFQLNEETGNSLDIEAAARYAARYLISGFAEHGNTKALITALQNETQDADPFDRTLYLFVGVNILKKTGKFHRAYGPYCRIVADRSLKARDFKEWEECKQKRLDADQLIDELQKILLSAIDKAETADESARRLDLYIRGCLSMDIKKYAKSVFNRTMKYVQGIKNKDTIFVVALKLGMTMFKLGLSEEARTALKLAQKNEPVHKPDATAAMLVLDSVQWVDKKGSVEEGLALISRLKNRIFSELRYSHDIGKLMEKSFDILIYACGARIMGYELFYKDFQGLIDLYNVYVSDKKESGWVEDYDLLAVNLIIYSDEGGDAVLKGYFEDLYGKKLIQCFMESRDKKDVTPEIRARMMEIYERTKDAYPHIAFRARLLLNSLTIMLWRNGHPGEDIPGEAVPAMKELAKEAAECTNNKKGCLLTPADVFYIYAVFKELGMNEYAMEHIKKCRMEKLVSPVTEEMFDPRYMKDIPLNALAIGKRLVSEGELVVSEDLRHLIHLGDEPMAREELTGQIGLRLAAEPCMNVNSYPLSGADNWSGLSKNIRITQLVKLYNILAALDDPGTIRLIQAAIEQDGKEWEDTEVGGYVSWPQNGVASQFEFIPAETVIGNDRYILPERLIDALDGAMLMVHLHGDAASDPKYCSGPSMPDLYAAEEHGVDGLIINWRPSEDKFRAIFYTTLGFAFDLGLYDLPRKE